MKKLFATNKTFVLLIISTFSQLLFAQGTSDSIDVFIKEKMSQMKIPGLQLAIIKDGKLEKLHSYGFANLEHRVATNSKTTFSINSMTKAFVGVAIMQLQEQGKLKIDNPISLYISHIPNEWK
ncbi:beta-lactamase family protein, partial [Epilithonimonas sp. JDS]|uniref:serine hydrolase domain-containing protein n=1 Tax=Epilithonimonas sp. JDS TaxID=2902797 RepID=UPI001E29D811